MNSGTDKMYRAICISVIATVSAFALDGRITTQAGIDTNPSGLANSSTEGVGTTALSLKHAVDAYRGTLLWNYRLDANGYAQNGSWSGHTHTLGARYTRSLASRLSYSGRAYLTYDLNTGTYADYDNQTLGLEASVRYPIAAWRLAAHVGLSRTTNNQSAALSNRTTELSGSISHTWDTRTTLRIESEWQTRSYESPALDWTLSDYNYDGSSQWSVWLRASQGLTKTVGTRLDLWHDRGIGDPWRIDPISDAWLIEADPLASSTDGISTQLSWLGFGGLTYRLSGRYLWLENSASEQQFVDPDLATGLEPRSDQRAGLSASVDGLIPWWMLADKPLGWTAAVSHSRQTSTLPDYTWNRTAANLGLQYAW
ncbi:MAG: hypothetical protein QGH20_00035 [Candidatus Latescibacteria bacterium]|jgi:hypothetical protein|nr:hypothetical protein [Candidatus Latescibacterota bacterium]